MLKEKAQINTLMLNEDISCSKAKNKKVHYYANVEKIANLVELCPPLPIQLLTLGHSDNMPTPPTVTQFSKCH